MAPKNRRAAISRTNKGVAQKLSGKPRCSHCGHELEEGDTVRISDWNLQMASGEFEDGVLKSEGNWEQTKFWKDEEEIDCPRCGEVAPADDWGVEIEYSLPFFTKSREV